MSTRVDGRAEAAKEINYFVRIRSLSKKNSPKLENLYLDSGFTR